MSGTRPLLKAIRKGETRVYLLPSPFGGVSGRSLISSLAPALVSYRETPGLGFLPLPLFPLAKGWQWLPAIINL